MMVIFEKTRSIQLVYSRKSKVSLVSLWFVASLYLSKTCFYVCFVDFKFRILVIPIQLCKHGVMPEHMLASRGALNEDFVSFFENRSQRSFVIDATIKGF